MGYTDTLLSGPTNAPVARTERRLAKLPDRLRADVGLGPSRNGINDWMYDLSFSATFVGEAK
jgi:hypothetical protein